MCCYFKHQLGDVLGPYGHTDSCGAHACHSITPGLKALTPSTPAGLPFHATHKAKGESGVFTFFRSVHRGGAAALLRKHDWISFWAKRGGSFSRRGGWSLSDCLTTAHRHSQPAILSVTLWSCRSVAPHIETGGLFPGTIFIVRPVLSSPLLSSRLSLRHNQLRATTKK